MSTYKLEDLQNILMNKLLASNNAEAMYRYQHSMGVLKTSLELVERFNLTIPEEKVWIAALLHDYAKYETLERYEEIVKEYGLGMDVHKISFTVLHGLLAPYVLMEELCIVDVEILDAIRYHTTGYPSMGILAEVIYLADFIEPTRKGPEFDQARSYAMKDIKLAIAYTAKVILNHLQKYQQKIHPYTREVYEQYKKYLRKEELASI